MERKELSRRRFLELGAGATLAFGCGSRVAPADAAPTAARAPREATGASTPPPSISPYSDYMPVPAAAGDRRGAPAPTPQCVETEDDVEGPFYKSGAPERADLVEPGVRGRALVVRGRVLDPRCTPLAGALLDVWQADFRDDGSGTYDLQGHRLRGKLRADGDGRFELRTIVPGHYPLTRDRLRPAHIHVKASAPGHRLLTTQLYFGDDPHNEGDPFFDPSLVLAIDGEIGRFDFVLAPDPRPR